MKKLFLSNTLSVSITKRETTIIVYIQGDYINSSRKSRLYVNGDNLKKTVEECWGDLKKITRKISEFKLYFDEIDYYDNMTNVYETPVITLQKGKSVAKLSHREHGSIPKDWSINVNLVFENVKQKKVIIESLKCIMGNHITPKMEKDLNKMNEILNGKKSYLEIFSEED